jgi:hypothetical protein
MLDHDEEMVAAFVAFNAHEPDCMVMAKMFKPVVTEYYKAKKEWDSILWSSYLERQEYDPSGLTIEQMEERMREAYDADRVAVLQQRLAAAQNVMAETAPRMFRDADARKRYAAAADSIRYIELALTSARAATDAWAGDIDTVRGYENAAAEADDVARSVMKALASFKPRAALTLLNSLEELVDHHIPQAVGGSTWDEFRWTANELALDLERYYEE